jgi:hypothetical protein
LAHCPLQHSENAWHELPPILHEPPELELDAELELEVDVVPDDELEVVELELEAVVELELAVVVELELDVVVVPDDELEEVVVLELEVDVLELVVVPELDVEVDDEVVLAMPPVPAPPVPAPPVPPDELLVVRPPVDELVVVGLPLDELPWVVDPPVPELDWDEPHALATVPMAKRPKEIHPRRFMCTSGGALTRVCGRREGEAHASALGRRGGYCSILRSTPPAVSTANAPMVAPMKPALCPGR